MVRNYTKMAKRTGTIMVHGSDNVMAPFGEPSTFYRGKWQDVTITKVIGDKDVPLEIRESLVGLTIPTIFTKEQIEKETGTTFPVPKESRLAYIPDVIEVLRGAGKNEAAEQLRKIYPNPLDMYVIEKEIYEPV